MAWKLPFLSKKPELGSAATAADAAASDQHPAEAPPPTASPVHIISDGSLVCTEAGTLRVDRPGAACVSMPIEYVSTLHLHGHASATGPAIGALVEAGATVIWRGHHGFPRAIAHGFAQTGVATRMAQYDASRDPKRCLSIACSFVHAKIIGARGILRRRRSDEKALAVLATLARKALRAQDLASLLGIEGAAGAAYFQSWSDLLRRRAAEMNFERRSRRPPLDPANALLSYYYAILAGECLCAVAAAGLDPRLGFLHRVRSGRPALALDLLELFRAPIADTTALMAFNTGELTASDFEGQHATRLSDSGRRKAIAALERRLASFATRPGAQAGITWRSAVETEARRLARALVQNSSYSPALRP